MFKIPFINRERYIVIKAYTFDKRVHKLAPIVTSNNAVKAPPKPDDGFNFGTCFGYVASLKRSFTLQSWLEFMVDYQSNPQSPYIAPPNNRVLSASYLTDSAYPTPVETHMTKINVPWRITCSKPDVFFVQSKHITNTTPMMIPTGVLNFGVTAAIPIFNLISEKVPFKVPFLTPLVAFFPMSDLPIHVESIFDKDAYTDLSNLQFSKTHFRGSAIKQHITMTRGKK